MKCVSEELLTNDLQMLYPYFACDLELLLMNWQYLFDSMLSVELKLYKFIIIIVIVAIIVIYACIIFISF